MSGRAKGGLIGGGLFVLLLPVALVVMILQVVGAGLGSTSGALVNSAQAASRCNTGKPASGGGGGPVDPIDPGKVSGNLTGDQKANAAKIAEQVKVDITAADRMQALVVALATAMQESSLTNISYGDTAGPDSRGLFQQRAPWGPLADRMDPHKAAHMFLTGGQGGQRGLTGVFGWQNMAVTLAAQAVQVSAFPLAYAKWESSARALAKALLGAPTGPAPSAAPTVAPSPVPTTVNVACPTDPTPGTGPGVGPAPGKGGWVAPLPAGSWVMTSPFGWRMHPVVHQMKLHTGDDLSAPAGTPIYAVFGGTVKAAAPNDGYGNQVVIAHGGGVDSAYNHMSVIIAKQGQQVKAGQLVGKVGTTGMSTGNHLHFEIRINEKPIDPVPFMRARGVKLDVK